MSTALALLILLQAAPSQDAPQEQSQERPDGGLGTQVDPADPIDPDIIDGRRRPGFTGELPDPVTQDNRGAVRAPPPQAFPADQIPIPDRWRLIQNLGLVTEDALDPYNQNTYKGDRPICINSDEERQYRAGLRAAAEEEERARAAEEGRIYDPAGVPYPYGSDDCWTPRFLGLEGNDWFFVANAISDTVIEPRTFPIPVGVQTTSDPDRLDVFGNDFSPVFSQTFIFGAALIKGSTAYKPPDVEYRLTLAYNISHVDVPERRVLLVEPSRASNRTDQFLGVQEAFFDYHIRNTSDRYDFDSFRIGIQPFQADFRGFLFQDSQLGLRFFGTRDNNRFQYNLGAFWRLEKDTNSGLNSVVQAPRSDFVFVANAYRQDFLIPALTSQFTLVYNMNREGGDVEIDDNGFPVRPALLGDLRGRDYDVVYVGYNADGRIGRINVTASLYGAFGEDRNSIFTGQPADIRSFFGAAELSYDRDWARFRLSALFANGDSDPFNNVEAGYDAIFENPIFAGADTSYWMRQTIPFAGGGRAISLNGRNGLLNSLRSSKEQGQSNFNNPGLILTGLGADFDLTPELRISTNANHLWFEDTTVLETLRVEGSIPADIGYDVSTAAIWRPRANQNLVFRLSAAALVAGEGFQDLFDNRGGDNVYYSVLANATLSY
ncbi:hypothetical protein [Aurantiacibacter marinus]|uniref:Alginate export domain-containing protein n=1 Tax=Aurantiacibacter marinus TaxID=874156 RepID=A0A0H0XPF9_9SPHN|nr:hypothetical protein [Aurantiacibacter marinus]KLI64493.1 hypothetical protein AAV99_02585 [Aurantiacibacter marinus]